MPRVTITRNDGSTMEFDTTDVELVERRKDGTVVATFKGGGGYRDVVFQEEEAEPLTRALKALIARGL